MYDFEAAVAEAHDVLLDAGHGWAQPRVTSKTERLEAARLPVERISAAAPKLMIEQRLVRIQRIGHLAVRFASLAMMTRVTRLSIPPSVQASDGA